MKNIHCSLINILHVKTVVLFSLISLFYGTYKVLNCYLAQNTKTIPPNDLESCRNDALPFCNISDDIQFKKFFLLALDGVSFEFIQPLLDIFGEHAQIYQTSTNLNRYTKAMFRTIFTGRDNINLQPFAINEDNAMLSFFRTYGKKLFLLGRPNWFIDELTIPPKDIYYAMDVFYDTSDAESYRVYDTVLNRKYKERLNKDLKFIEENELSVLGYEGHTDDVQHIEAFAYNCSKFILAPNLVKHLAEDIIPIKEWIEDHPEYLFIIFADHGHDEIVPEDNPKPISIPYVKEFSASSQVRYYYHGGNANNNTGWWMFYHHSLTPSFRRMNITDASSTWMKYLKNIDIPVNSVGRPMNSMKYIRNEVKVKQQGLAQLWNLCRNSTNHCKGRVYEEGLKWEPGMVKEENLKDENSESVSEAKKEEMALLVKNMVSVSAEELFPYNISVDELRKIAEGRDENPRKKEIQNRTCHYYFEFDEDEDGNLFYNLKEKKEKLGITKEDAIEILNKYDSFVNESEILHTLLYHFSVIFDKFFYLNNSSRTKFWSNQVVYISVILNVVMLYFFLRESIHEFYRRIKSNAINMKNEKLIRIIIFSLLIIIILTFGKVVFSIINKFNNIFEFFSRPSVLMIVFRDYKPFTLIYAVIAKHLCLYLIIVCCIYILKLSLNFIIYIKKVRNNEVKEENYESSERINNSYLLYLKFFISKDVYNNYIWPILKIIISVYFLPKILPFMQKSHEFRMNEKKYNEYKSKGTFVCFKTFRFLFYLTLADLILFFLRKFLVYKKKWHGSNNKVKEVKKKKKLFFSLTAKCIFFIICWNFVVFADPSRKRKYFRGFHPNMIAIVFFSSLYLPVEILKKRREDKDNNSDVPSIFAGIKEILESWSILNGMKKCGAYTIYNFYVFIVLSLFLVSQPLHFKNAIILINLYTYVLLPLFYFFIRRLYDFVDLKKNEDEKSKNINFNTSLSNSKESEYLLKQDFWINFFNLIFSWIEVVVVFLTVQQLVDYLTFSILGWYYSAGEDCGTVFEFASHWIGIADIGYSHLLTCIEMGCIKSGYMIVLCICSGYTKSCTESIFEKKNRMKLIKEEKIEDKSSAISSSASSELEVSLSDNKNNGKFFELSFSERLFKVIFSTLFVPMILSTTFYIASLNIRSYAGSMSEYMKLRPFLINTMNFAIGLISIIIPLLF